MGMGIPEVISLLRVNASLGAAKCYGFDDGSFDGRLHVDRMANSDAEYCGVGKTVVFFCRHNIIDGGGANGDPIMN